MSFTSQSRLVLLIVIMMMALAVAGSPVQAQSPEIYLSLTDTTVAAGDTTAWISVFMANYQDTLAAFTMRIVLDNPELVDFRTDAVDSTFDTVWEYCGGWNAQGVCTLWVDTMYVDTMVNSGAIDTTGTMISGWEYVTAQSYSQNRTDIKVTAMADWLGGEFTQGVLPRSNPACLFRLRVRAHDETTDSTDNTVTLIIVDNLSETAFSDPHGEFFGVSTGYNICDTTMVEEVMVIDTFYRYWICQAWDGPDCTDWESTTNPDSAIYADSISIDAIPWSVRNEATTFYVNGHMTVSFIDCVCGDANNDGLVNVGDPVYLINFIFKGGPGPENPECADANNDGEVNVGDAVYLINHVFKGGPGPVCD